MNLLSLAGGKVQWYALGVLALALLLSNLGWWAHASALGLQRDVADATRDAADARAEAVGTEKTAWKNKAGELEIANLAAQKTVDQLKIELATAQGEKHRLQQQGQQAIAAAQRAAADADRTLQQFVDRYAQQLRNPDCAGAMAVVQQSCPALEGY
jgi:hypothetical protein